MQINTVDATRCKEACQWQHRAFKVLPETDLERWLGSQSTNTRAKKSDSNSYRDPSSHPGTCRVHGMTKGC